MLSNDCPTREPSAAEHGTDGGGCGTVPLGVGVPVYRQRKRWRDVAETVGDRVEVDAGRY